MFWWDCSVLKSLLGLHEIVQVAGANPSAFVCMLAKSSVVFELVQEALDFQTLPSILGLYDPNLSSVLSHRLCVSILFHMLLMIWTVRSI